MSKIQKIKKNAMETIKDLKCRNAMKNKKFLKILIIKHKAFPKAGQHDKIASKYFL